MIFLGDPLRKTPEAPGFVAAGGAGHSRSRWEGWDMLGFPPGSDGKTRATVPGFASRDVCESIRLGLEQILGEIANNSRFSTCIFISKQPFKTGDLH